VEDVTDLFGAVVVSTTLARRFDTKVDRSSGASACWPWTGARKNGWGGYGLIMAGAKGAGVLRAHRVAWVLANERAIPEGMVVLHTCDNPVCCNPTHLRLGTQSDNSLDMHAKGRAVAPPRLYGSDHPRWKGSAR
jgi:hypothetical protein